MKGRIEKLESMLEHKPQDPFLRYALAMELMKAGKSDRAATLFGKLLGEQPDYVPAYLQYALLLRDEGDESRAAEVVRAGIEQARLQNEAKAVSELTFLLQELE